MGPSFPDTIRLLEILYSNCVSEHHRCWRRLNREGINQGMSRASRKSPKVPQMTAGGSSLEAALGCISWKHGFPSLSPRGPVFDSFKERNYFLFLSDLFCMEQPSHSRPLGVSVLLFNMESYGLHWRDLQYGDGGTEQSVVTTVLSKHSFTVMWPSSSLAYTRFIVCMFSYTGDLGK